MAYTDFKRYVWLIDLLDDHNGMSFEDIDEKWQLTKDYNPQGEKLPPRTFYNHIKAIRSIFGIEIRMLKKDHRYRIIPGEDIYAGRIQKALLSMLSLNRTAEIYKGLKGRILYEEEPDVYPEWIRCILRAMNSCKRIRLEYKKYGDNKSSFRHVSPYCLKMFKRRWYLLAQEDATLKTFALDDRTISVEVLNSGFKMPDDFDAEAYFKNTFGIRTAPPKRVVFKAYGREVDYLRSSPIHPSQEEIATEKDYAVFALYVGMDTWEFYQEILSRGDRVEILSPLTLRESISERIEEMRLRYAKASPEIVE